MKQIIISETAVGWTATIRGGESFALPHSLDASMFDVSDDVKRLFPGAQVCFLASDPNQTAGTRD